MKPNQLVLWLLGGAGTFFLYCAVKNLSPASLIESYFDKSVTPKPLTGAALDDGSKVNPNNGLVDPKSRGDSGPLLDPNNPNNLFPDVKTTTYISPTGAVVAYPSAYQSSPNTFIRT